MEIANPRLSALIARLDRLSARPSLVELSDALESAGLTSADVTEFVRPSDRGYSRVRVVAREKYELLVMTWRPGQASPPHDHAGSTCALQVLQGEATEGCFAVAPDGYVDLQYETLVRSGQMSAGQDAGIHSVRNAATGSELLVTVHLYSPPLSHFRQYVPRPEPVNRTSEPAPRRDRSVVVVGGGFSGAMTAANLLRRAGDRPIRVTLVERRGSVGEGVAYGTRDPAHLLNVPAGKMSAWTDRPDDFVAWASRRDPAVRPGDFLPRTWYGEYVRETLLAARPGRAGAGLDIVFEEVRRVARHPDGGWVVHFDRGSSLRADAVVLAIGHRPPSDPFNGRWTGPRARLITDPWKPFVLLAIEGDDPVVVVGSGLTAVDCVLSLAQHPRTAPITVVSRHGYWPHAHAPAPVPPLDLSPLIAGLIPGQAALSARGLLRGVRRFAREHLAAGGDWRAVVDGIRPHTARLWQAMPVAERRRFISRVRPFWEVHRHRMAASIAERIRSLESEGLVRIVPGVVLQANAGEDEVAVGIRRRGESRPELMSARWVINCTGPTPSNSVESNPAIGSLLIHDWLLPDELSLGLETAESGQAVARDGRVVRDLFIVGTLRKPALWESTAVPELREQAEQTAVGVLAMLDPAGAADDITAGPAPVG
jgi:uncharacterized NAD(P)/FAD-binding protein YdhS